VSSLEFLNVAIEIATELVTMSSADEAMIATDSELQQNDEAAFYVQLVCSLSWSNLTDI
jgi:hypothetical protein